MAITIPGQNGGYPVTWADPYSENTGITESAKLFMAVRAREQERRRLLEQEQYKRQQDAVLAQRQQAADIRAEEAHKFELGKAQLDQDEARLRVKGLKFTQGVNEGRARLDAAEQAGSQWTAQNPQGARDVAKYAATPETSDEYASAPPDAVATMPSAVSLPAVPGMEPGSPNVSEARTVSPFAYAMQRAAAKKQADIQEGLASGRLVQDEKGNVIPASVANARENAAARRFDANQRHLDREAEREARNATNKDQVGSLVDSVLAGNISATDLGRSNVRAQVIAEASRREPGFTTQTYQSRLKMRNDHSSSQPGTAGGQIDSLNQLAEHMNQLDGLQKALASNDTRLINSAVNALRTQLGDEGITNAQTAALAVSEEVARLLKGGVAGEHEGESWLAKFNPNGSPAQMAGAINTTRHLVAARLKAKKTKWTAVMGKAHANEFDDYLGDSARAMFGESAPAAPQGQGDTRVGPDGRTYRRVNGGWKAE